MSKGLEYLAGKRPEAIQGLLAFYGKCTKALDDKTRFLISVVTKVATGTERGLRQYAPRAIKAGASKEELLDAVLMAFPAAGLTKIVDAVQILLEMDLLPPLESASPSSALPQELDLGPLEGFPIGEKRSIDTVRGSIVAFRDNAAGIQLYSGNCPHAVGDLTKGKCEGDTLECPVHHWKFNMSTGQNLNPKLAGLSSIKSAIRDGRVIAVFE